MLALMFGSTSTTKGPISTIGAVRRGLGAPVTKSAPLTSVSVAPLFLRKRAVVLLAPGAVVLPSLQFAVLPYPTRSTRSASRPNGQLESGSALLTSAIFPAVALMLIAAGPPTMLAAGSGAPTAPPEASETRKYSP